MKGDKKAVRQSTATVRRSVVLPRQMLRAALQAAPPELRRNVNRLVRVALQEYVVRQRERAFAAAMAEMAADPAIRRTSDAMAVDFREAEEDGLTR
jgi:hypothetical protein